MKKLRLIPVATAVLTLAITWSASAQTLDESLHIPRAQTSRGDSINWSGYAVSAQQVTSVTGTFSVPAIGEPGSVGGFPPDVSVWVGIDGYTSGTVEQVGIAGGWDAAAGQAYYYAWWEMYPRNSQIIQGMAISEGHSITASVAYLGRGTFKLSITDNTSGQSFTTTASAPVGGRDAAERSSAEWVVERAATIYKGYLTFLPLATFDDPVAFTDASYSIGNAGAQTLQDAVSSFLEYAGDGSTPPPQPFWEHMTMIGSDLDGNVIPLDDVSAVAGNSFTASFLDNGTALLYPGVIRKK
jgi:hypothetical protein